MSSGRYRRRSTTRAGSFLLALASTATSCASPNALMPSLEPLCLPLRPPFLAGASAFSSPSSCSAASLLVPALSEPLSAFLASARPRLAAPPFLPLPFSCCSSSASSISSSLSSFLGALPFLAAAAFLAGAALAPFLPLAGAASSSSDSELSASEDSAAELSASSSSSLSALRAFFLAGFLAAAAFLPFLAGAEASAAKVWGCRNSTSPILYCTPSLMKPSVAPPGIRPSTTGSGVGSMKAPSATSSRPAGSAQNMPS
mmetsp:Transcript_35050/g.88743  ORF Transcript_35050/g.88743 Transcript_35050/m.88743 type:complete len:258 (+) Transcript_35050:2546-3319(+)